MYPFSQSVTPAVRTHLDAQTAFMNDMAKAMFRSFQQMCNLNVQLAQTLLEETTTAGQQMLTADRQTELMSVAASRAQPITDKLRAYQQHLSRLAADTQVDMVRVTEQHVQNTTRTARTLADAVARNATEETERGVRAQQDAARRFTDPFARAGEAAPQSQGGSAQAGAALQGSGQDGSSQGSGKHASASQASSSQARPAGSQTH